MPNAVQAVEDKRERNQRLGSDLGGNGPRRETSRHDRRLEMPADRGRDEIRQAVDVQAAGEGEAGESVQHGEIPRYLGLVDAEMGSDGAVEALLEEDVGGAGGAGGGGGGCRGCCWPAGALAYGSSTAPAAVDVDCSGASVGAGSGTHLL
jgi:hypothetical protein